MAITDWPADERPREKLLSRGAGALSDAELLAIFLRIGVQGKSAVDLARDLLSRFGSLSAIFAASEAELSSVHGIGMSKFAQLQAVFEMVQRALGEGLRARDVLTSPEAVRDYLKLNLGALPHEVFMVLFLDAQNRLLQAERLFTGTLTQTSVYPREVVRRALHHNAAGVILAHNHPSGHARPSEADRVMTLALKAALDLVDIKVLDHFVVAGHDAVSFAEQGLL